jgi:hypothetical protein
MGGKLLEGKAFLLREGSLCPWHGLIRLLRDAELTDAGGSDSIQTWYHIFSLNRIVLYLLSWPHPPQGLLPNQSGVPVPPEMLLQHGGKPFTNLSPTLLLAPAKQ